MKKYIIGFALFYLLTITIFKVSEYTYFQGIDVGQDSNIDEYGGGVSVGKNIARKECDEKFITAFEEKIGEYQNFQYKCPVESNVVELCDCPIEDYEEMLDEREAEIERLNSLLLTNMYK